MARPHRRFVPAMLAAVAEAKASGMTVKVVQCPGGWKVTLNAAPRTSWELFWESMSAAAATDSCAKVFASQFESLVAAKSRPAIAAAPEVHEALMSETDVGATFFSRADTERLSEYSKGVDADGIPY